MPNNLRMALEMAEYGERLDAMFHFRGDPRLRISTAITRYICVRCLFSQQRTQIYP